MLGPESPWLVVLGSLLIVSAWLLWRGHRRGTVSRRRDPLAEARASLAARESGEAGQIREMEIRLYDFRREIEGEVDTKLRLLERLTANADREIARLLEAIGEARGHAESQGPTHTHADAVDQPVFRIGPRSNGPAPEVVDTARLLCDAGFDVAEIARLVDQPEAIVEELLGLDDHGLADAA